MKRGKQMFEKIYVLSIFIWFIVGAIVIATFFLPATLYKKTKNICDIFCIVGIISSAIFIFLTIFGIFLDLV